jgi:hypothetical protein
MRLLSATIDSNTVESLELSVVHQLKFEHTLRVQMNATSPQMEKLEMIGVGTLSYYCFQ